MLLSTGAEVDSVSSSTPEDDAASVNPPQAETDASAPSNGSSPWLTLAGSGYKPFTSPSLLRVLMHTTQPMSTGTGSERGPHHVSVVGTRPWCSAVSSGGPLLLAYSPLSTVELIRPLNPVSPSSLSRN